MKPIGIQRIEKRLDRFADSIDMTDWARRPADQQRVAFLSRAVAAYCVKILAGVDDETAGKSITDSYHDRGIDAIYFDAIGARLIVVQSKWGDCIAWKEAGEFADGVDRLIQPNWDSFKKNEKISKRKQEIELALTLDTRLVLVTAHKGKDPGDVQSLNRIDELICQIDNGSGLAKTVHWHQKHLLEAIQAESSPAAISEDLYFSNWGEIKEPYHAVYGRVQADQIARLWKAHPHLAYANLRDYHSQRTDVNAAIAATILESPQHFWYFNNGLTVICDSIRPALLGRLNPELTLFHLEGIRLVNGAQTTGVVSEHIDAVPESSRAKLWIQLRAIAVGNCPDGFAAEITKFTNLQNEVTQQAFAGLDPVQSRLAIDFAVEKRRYVFKWGTTPDPAGDEGCTLKEATIALACAEEDHWFPVQAKREISVLWNTGSERYRSLFHKDLTAQRVWNAVVIMRAVDGETLSLRASSSRYDVIGVHLRLVIVHLVFQSPQLAQWEERRDHADLAAVARQLCGQVFRKVVEYVSAYHKKDYLASLSKNFDKCERMIKALRSPDHQLGLFGEPY